MIRTCFVLLLFTIVCIWTFSWCSDMKKLLKRNIVSRLDRASVDKKVDGAIQFLALGDWGGAPLIGTLPDQAKTAKGMGRVAREMDVDFVVTLGDNFYLTGVDTVDSKRFHETFEAVYSDQSLMNIPWFMIGGNHDHFGNIDAQIQYTTSKFNTNQRWKFPSLYHAHSFTSSSSSSSKGHDSTTSAEEEEQHVTIDLLMIDTVDLCSKNEIIDEEDERYFQPLPLLPKSFAANNGEQWKWIEEQMSKSRADYLLVAGHYPVFSICIHGPTKTLIHHLRPLLLKYGAHYLAGHDHCMNHFVDHNPESTNHDENKHNVKETKDLNQDSLIKATHNLVLQKSDTNYILVGTGIDCCSPAWNRKSKLIPENVELNWSLTSENNGHLFWKKAKGGFSSFFATRQSMKVRYHDHSGNVLYESRPIKPRQIDKFAGHVDMAWH